MNFIKATNGTQIATTINGVRIATIQSVGYEANQELEETYVAEDADPAEISTGQKSYSLSFKVLEIQDAVLAPASNAELSDRDPERFNRIEIDGETYTSLFDLPEAEVVISYPNGRIAKFIGVKFGKVAGGFDIADKKTFKDMDAKARKAIGLL